MGAKGRDIKGRLEEAKRHHVEPDEEEKPSDSAGGSLRSTRSWGIPVEGFQIHVATDGSLLGASGKWGVCGWSVVQLDQDEEMARMHGMYGDAGCRA